MCLFSPTMYCSKLWLRIGNVFFGNSIQGHSLLVKKDTTMAGKGAEIGAEYLQRKAKAYGLFVLLRFAYCMHYKLTTAKKRSILILYIFHVNFKAGHLLAGLTLPDIICCCCFIGQAGSFL